MKKSHLLFLIAGLVLAPGFAPQAGAAPRVTSDNVSVIFQDPDKFTDVQENQSMVTSTYYLGELKSCLQENASPLLAAGQSLVITITDIDLAGDNNFSGPSHIRIMKEIYAPRVQLKFQLRDGDGKILKEGERTLSDLSYLQTARLVGSQDPLYYDKTLLKQWVRNEFRGQS